MDKRALSTKALYSVLFGFIFGVFVSPILSERLGIVFFLLMIAVAIIFLLFLFLESEKRFTYLPIVLFVVFCAVGVFRFDMKDRHQLPEELEASVGGEIRTSGIVIEVPEKREKYTRAILEITEGIGADEKLLIWLPHQPVFQYGDNIEVSGELKKPESFETEAGVFNYPEYLAKSDIYYEVSFAEGELLSRGGGNLVKRTLFSLREAFSGNLEEQIREPETSLAKGILLGERSGLGESLEDTLRVAGIIHIVVLSGYNIAIVAETVRRLTAWLSKRYALLFSVLCIALFTVMVGGGATVVRAVLFASIAILGKYGSRSLHVGRALLIVAALMILWNPKILAYDPSFQLSFLATVGLVYLSPRFIERINFLPKKLEILREIIGTTIATQLAVLPWLLHMTGQFSIYSLPVNVIVLPFIPIVMLLCFLAGVFGFILPILAFPLGLVSQLLISFILAVSELFSRLPFSSINIPAPSTTLVLFIYASILAAVYFLKKIKQNRTLLASSVS